MNAHLEKLRDLTIAFVGAGSIAEALIKGVSETGVGHVARLRVVNRKNRERLAYLQATYSVQTSQCIHDAVHDANVVVLCVKPKDIVESLAQAAQHAKPDTLYLSVVAGCSLESMRKLIVATNPTHSNPHIVRAMPNTSCAVRQSATAFAMTTSCSARDRDWTESILDSVGKSYPIAEHLINAVTGLAGSGPAYVYYLVEAMTLAGIDVGLSEEDASALVIQTLFGAAHMLRSTAESPTTLRERVTSPGGTTFAGISTLKLHHFEESIRQAVISATKRSAELGAELSTHVHV